MTQTLEDLLEGLEDVDDATREEAAKALAERAEPSTLDALIRACGDDFWSVRAYAGSLFLGVVLILGYYLWQP